MIRNRTYSPFVLRFGDTSIDNFPGIKYEDGNIIFQTNEDEINIRQQFKEHDVNTMQINGNDVTLNPVNDKFTLTDNLKIPGEAIENVGGFKKKTYKKKTKRRAKKGRPTKNRRPTNRRQIKKRRPTKRRR
tara:strand:- start:577 stop:969 length:393 start_codon:yes stop_codon:yes gene_type:complete